MTELQIGAYALAAGGVVALIGVLVLRLLRGRSILVHTLVMLAVTVLAVVAGVVAVARAMFLSGHDLRVVLITVSASALVSLGVGAVFGRRLAASAVWAETARARERRLEAGRRELVLRVRSVLRRTAAGETVPAHPEMLTDGDLTVDTARRIARLRGVPLALTVREFDLLVFLLSNPRRAWSRTDLLGRVWGWQFGDQSTVTVHVRRLREKIEPDPSEPARVLTVWGVGYRYEPVATR